MQCISVQLCLVILVILGIDNGYCIECYSCSSKETEACKKFDKSKITLTKCDMKGLSKTKQYAENINSAFAKFYDLDLQSQEPQVPMNCLKQSTKVGDQEIVLRGCQLASTEQLDICVKIKKLNNDNIQTNYCSLCNSDNCNSGQQQGPNLIFPIIFFIFYFYC